MSVCASVQLETHSPENTNKITDVRAHTCTTFHFLLLLLYVMEICLPTKRAFWAVDTCRCSLSFGSLIFVTWLDNWTIVDYTDKQQHKPICSYI